MEILEQNKISKILFVLLVILSLYFAVRIFSEFKKTSMLGESPTPATISFSGHGEVTAVPDIANVYFIISKVSKTAKEAQEIVAKIEKNALDILKSNNIMEKDIKTENASVYPKYEWKSAPCPVSSGMMYPCPSGENTLVGYEANESITVKIRKIDDAGKVMQGLSIAGISNLSGPNFAIDDEDGLKAEARKKAIDDAKTKAKILAKDLGVSLVKITAFSENGNYPIMYGGVAMMSAKADSAPAPAQLPKGENTITSDVTITYEIR